MIASEDEISGSKPIEMNSPTPIAKLPNPMASSAIKKVGVGFSRASGGNDEFGNDDDKS